MNPKNDWSQFTILADIHAPVEVIYAKWATSQHIESWFLRSAIYTKPNQEVRAKNSPIQKGDSYLWHWHGYSDEVFENKEIIEANGKDFLQFTFSGDCLVSVQIRAEKGVTLVELKQERIPEEKDPNKSIYVQCSLGWTFYLTNLKSILEGGVDLRNKRMDLMSHFK